MDSRLENIRLPSFIENPNPNLYLTQERLVLDFETTNLDKGDARNLGNRIILGSVLASGGTRVALGPDSLGKLFSLLDGRILLAHNAKFELAWLRRLGYPIETLLVFDTMMAEKVLAGNRLWPLDLDSLSRKYGGTEKNRLISTLMKTGVCPSAMPRELLQSYCDEDVSNTELIFQKQLVELQKLNLLPVVYTRCLLLPVLVDIEAAGMQLDPQRVADEYNRTGKEYTRVADALTGFMRGANPNSPKQLAAFLYDACGFEEVKRYDGQPDRTPTGSRKTDKPTLARLRARTKEQEKILGLIKEQAKLDTKLNNYLSKFKLACEQNNGLLKGDISQVIPRTHRLSSQGGKYKVQFHNMDRLLKPMIRARTTGWDVGEADQAQLEFRVATYLTQDPQGMDDISHKVDVHTITQEFLAARGQKQSRVESKPMCVPLDSEILTRAGWKSYADVSIGEDVLSYNQSRNVSEWVPLLEKVVYKDAPVWECGTSHWKVWSTPNHRWYGDKRTDHGTFRKYEPCVIETKDVHGEHRLYTAAEEHDSPGLPISLNEAAILGWLWSDGSVQISPLTKRAAQGLNGERQLHTGQIIQKKYHNEIRDRLDGYDFRETVEAVTGIHRFFLSSPELRSLYRKSWRGSKLRTVLAMSFDQRHHWLEAVKLAEGTQRPTREWRIAQNVGDMQEAIRAACTLNGIDTRISITPKEQVPGANYDNVKTTCRKQSHITGQNWRYFGQKKVPVWCPRTKNGTWVMRQGKVITITGNTFRPVYGGTSGTDAERAYCKFFNEKYHVMHKEQSKWEMEVLKSKYLTTVTGLRFYWPEIRLRRNGLTTEHSSVFNYPVQYFATGEMVPIGLVYVWHMFKAMALKAFLINTVHDSVVWENPPEERKIISEICQRGLGSCVVEYLKKVYGISLNVPLEVEIAFGSHWGEHY